MTATPRARRRSYAAFTASLDESLLVRLVTSFIGLALLSVGLTATAAFFTARSSLRDQVLDRLKTVAFMKEGELNRWVEEMRTDLVFIAQLPQLRGDAAVLQAPRGPADAAARAQMEALLDSAQATALDMDEVFVLSAVGGEVLASTDRRRIGEYRVNDLFFTRGRTGTFIQNVYLSPGTGRPTVTIATPIRAGGTTIAVLAGHLNLERIDRILQERSGLGATGEAYLVTPLNELVTSNRFGRADVRRGVHSDGIQSALAGEGGAGLYENYAGVRVLGAWRWNAQRQLALLVEMHAVEAFAPARELVGTILGFGIGSALLLAIGIWLIARRIVEPILAVARTAREVAAGNFEATAPVVTRDEVGLLARAFNDMTLRLRGVYADLNRQVDETYRAYRALEESQQLLQAVVDNTANLIVVLDASGKFLLVNRRFEDLFHLRHEDARGREPSQVMPSDTSSALEHAARGALLSQRAFEIDSELHLDGVRHHYHFVAFPLVKGDHAPFGVGVLGTDLSERTRAEEERRRLEAGVQQAQKLEGLGLLAGGVAHDFNNILTAIIGSAAVALEELPAASPSRADLEQVISAAERAAKLTRQMLAYAGRASFTIETFDLNAVIREMAELIAIAVPKQVALRHLLEPSLPPLRGDRTQVSQIVLNLITNAAEATGAKGGTVTVRTGLVAKADIALAEYRFVPNDSAAFVSLVVDDTGAGMAPETMTRMFDPFFSTKGSGRGLGLAAVLGIVRQSGGTMKVTSISGGGTTFTVLFPAADRALLARPGTAAPAAAAPEPQSGVILMVDDEAVVRRATRRILERAGFVVIECVNGQEAVDRFAAEGGHISVVILDVTMPVMGGAEAFRRMRALGPPVPVIVSSGYDQADTISAFTGEMVEFLQKPYTPNQLLGKIRDIMAGNAARP